MIFTSNCVIRENYWGIVADILKGTFTNAKLRENITWILYDEALSIIIKLSSLKIM